MKFLRGCPVNPKEIADDFYEAYERCFEGKDTHQDEYGRIVSHIVAIPGMVNGLFAFELYLKYLLGDNLKKLKEKERHNLKCLFNVLDDSYKSKLKLVECDQRYTLDGLLSDIGDGFIKWRYIYEDGNKKFGNDHPFEFTEYFLKNYLPVIREIATNKFEAN